MALDIIKLYISLLSEFFMFSDSHVMTPPSNAIDTTPPLSPKDSNSITTAHHLMKILGEVQDSVNDINSMDISNEATSSLRGLLESARWKFEDILIHAWLRGMGRVHTYTLIWRTIEHSRRQYFLLCGRLGRLDH